MRFGFAAGFVSLLAVMIVFLPTPVKAEAMGAGGEALGVVSKIEGGFERLQAQLKRRMPWVEPESKG